MEAAEIVLPLLVACAVSAALTPLVGRLAGALGAVDRPSIRSVAHRPGIPLLGGLAVALGVLMGLAVGLWLVNPLVPSRHLAGLVVGGLVLLACGLWDDRFGMAAFAKFGLQVVAAVIAVASGFQMGHITEPISGTTFFFPPALAWVASVLWIVGITNAMNLVDGLDGLATGVGAIICATLTVILFQAGQPFGILLGVALLGALLGFLPFNFPPARIFLGDTGSLFIGYTLSLLALEGYRQVTVITFVVPLLALAVPILDTALSIVRRLRMGQPVFRPDRLHLHHRLLARRGSARGAVLQFYFLTACFSLIAVSFAKLQGTLAAVSLVFVLVLTLRLLSNLGVLSASGTDELAQAEEENG